MKKSALFVTLTLAALVLGRAQEIDIGKDIDILGRVKPIPVSLSGFSGETEEVLKFDLYVQGYSFVSPAEAQFNISGSNGGNVVGQVVDKLQNKTILSRSYNGASLRRQSHAFADDIVAATLQAAGKEASKPIGGGKIAYKSQTPYGIGEIYLADFDGNNGQQITHDGVIVAKPAWLSGKLALFYTSYAQTYPEIFYQNLSTGQRKVFADFPGLNTSASVSPDGSKVAMVLSKSGSPNIWIANASGGGFKRLTTGLEDSSPCWSPDGRYICFATKFHERRRLAKIPAGGGEITYLNTAGAGNPTEPDWSPDGKWIAFTRLAGDFDICVMPADGNLPPKVMVAGQNPSWSPNSRTLIFNHGSGGHQTLSVLDVFTKQYKDCRRAPGSNSQAAWAR
ncbi:MAG TPA: hypothetical protein VF607_11535 [Verrucomicrobiae bacterium]